MAPYLRRLHAIWRRNLRQEETFGYLMMVYFHLRQLSLPVKERLFCRPVKRSSTGIPFGEQAYEVAPEQSPGSLISAMIFKDLDVAIFVVDTLKY